MYNLPIPFLWDAQSPVLPMQCMCTAVQLVSLLVWSPPPTVLAAVSVAASANLDLSSREHAVCHWRTVAVWMSRITIMRSL